MSTDPATNRILLVAGKYWGSRVASVAAAARLGRFVKSRWSRTERGADLTSSLDASSQGRPDQRKPGRGLR